MIDHGVERHVPYVVCVENDDDDDDKGRINFSVALSLKITGTRNKKPKQRSHVKVVSAMRRC